MLKLNELQTPSKDEFRVIEKEWLGKQAVLINPCVKNPKWVIDNKWFRSSIWDKVSNNALSLGFPKFFNIHEQNSHIADIENFTLVEKKDGSLCIVDIIDNQMNSRPRGSYDSSAHINLPEQIELLTKYKVAELAKKYREYSILFEIVSPSVPIIVKYKSPELYLIGMIHKPTGILTSQAKLDELGENWSIPRPKTWNTIGLDKKEIIETIRDLEHQEGYCAYDASGQHIIKLKSKWYISLHSFKSHCTYSEVVNWFVEQWEKNPENPGSRTLEYIRDTLDWECVEIAKPMVEKVNELFKPISHNLFHARKLATEAKNTSAKDFAHLIQYTPHLRTFAFSFYNNKDIKTEQIRKLLYNEIKKANLT